MNKQEQIELAKAYVALSNTHKINLILPLLSEDIFYSSTSVGEFIGKNAVEEMMNGFFTRFPDVHWEVNDYQYSEDRIVSFDFVMAAKNIETDEQIERKGLENIIFSDEGMIKKIKVIAQ
ncbi:MAG: nuclear transport factor 2 family protein [Gammaproteobacteria bacterium]